MLHSLPRHSSLFNSNVAPIYVRGKSRGRVVTEQVYRKGAQLRTVESLVLTSKYYVFMQ